MKPLWMPAIFLIAMAAILNGGLFMPAAATALFAFYAACVMGLLLAWRFHSIRIFTGLLVLFLSHQAVSYYCSGHLGAQSARIAVIGVGILLPANLVLALTLPERGFTAANLGPTAVFLLVESVVVMVLCQSGSSGPQRIAHHIVAPVLPFAVLLGFAAAVLIFLARFLFSHKPSDAGFLWSLAASFLGLRYLAVPRVSTSYFAVAAFLLTASVIESSYLLAYQDELTALPSRRAFNEALVRLAPPYTIAMVDVDHFKRCNDTYGHDAGDQVLRMVASRLARVPDGGEAFRCGGEEFAILFSGKATTEVLGALESLRREIEMSNLRLRGPDRRQQPRGPDRRNQRARSRLQTGHAIRQLAKTPPLSEISVTVSIGVASSMSGRSSAREIIQAADKALYRAKQGGRNRVETVSARTRARSATA